MSPASRGALSYPHAWINYAANVKMRTSLYENSLWRKHRFDCCSRFLASFAAIPTQAETTAFQFSKNLQLRDAGPDVRLLQQYLNAQGFLVAQSGPGSAGSETLTFGLRTYRALVSYQEVHNLPATGFFGPLTRATVTAISSAGSTPSNTSTNPSGSSQQSGSSNAQSLAPTSSQQTIPLSPPSVRSRSAAAVREAEEAEAATVSLQSPTRHRQ